MIFDEHLNVQYGKEFGINPYFNSVEMSRNHYTMNNVVVNCWDLEATKKVFSVEHEFFNNNYHELLYGTNLHNASYTLVNNDTNTSKKIVYYVVFERVPFELLTPQGKIYDGSVSLDFVNDVMTHLQEILNHYTNANVIVCSNILKYRTENGIKNDLLMSNINELNNARLSYDAQYDLNSLNPSEVLGVFSNKVSYLFAHCNSKGMPIVLRHDIEDKFSVFDDYIYKKFNKITDTEFKVFTNDEFSTTPINAPNNTFTVDPKYTSGKSMVEKQILVEQTGAKQYQKLFFHCDAHIIKPLFETNENKALVNIVSNPEEVDESTLIVTLNNKSYYNNFLRKNHERFYNWLGIDFDILNEDSTEKSMRYYMQSFGNIKPMYSFSTKEEIQTKFNITSLKNVELKSTGKILLCLDYPVGINYSSLNKWYTYWNNVISKLKTKFTNHILVKTYFDDQDRKSKTKEVYDKLFRHDDYRITYDNSSESFMNVMKRDDIYFCVKCQGALFLKCFTNGKVLLSGLPKEDILKKPDKSFFMNIEHSLNDVVEDVISLSDVVTNYNAEQFNILNTTTQNLTTIDDIKKGSFVNKIIKN